MKLLIITQVIDTEHPILGFFHRWVEEFAKHCEHVHIICLQEGKHALPNNVTVHSLGKESGKGRLTYLYRFYTLIWKLRHEYDSVFVHMNQIYVILGAPLWRLFSKKVGLWYAHGNVTVSLQIATKFTNYIFTSTAEGFRIKSTKTKIIGQGIDTQHFKSSVGKISSNTLKLITVGRISQSKNLETLLKACKLLKENGTPFTFKIVGAPLTESEVAYASEMTKLVKDLGLEKEVVWAGVVSQKKLPTELQQADVFIHDGSTNSLDKTLLEASLCGCVVVSSNPAYVEQAKKYTPDFLYKTNDFNQLGHILEKKLFLKDCSRELREYIETNFTVNNLISAILQSYKK